MRNLFVLIALVAAAVAPPAFAQEQKVPLVDASSKGIAIKGYDTVAYFEQSQAVKGSPKYEYTWAKWLFATAAHRDAFAKDPTRYAPQYGGFCGFGMSQGHAVPGDPGGWKIVDGKLYLYFNKDIPKERVKDIPRPTHKAHDECAKL